MSPEAVTRVKAQMDGGRGGGVSEEKWEQGSLVPKGRWK